MLDAADADAVDGCNLDVAFVTVGGTPGVSDDVVVLARLGTITDSSDGMVESGSTVWIVEDARLVVSKRHGISVHSHRGWALSNGSLELINRLWWDVGIVSDSHFTFGGSIVAFLVDCGIWVVRLGLLTMSLEVSESS